MTTPRRRLSATLALAIVGLALAACSDAAGPHDEMGHTFDLEQSAIKVDTPALRAQKAAAGISPCPNGDATAHAVTGGLPDLTLPCLGGGPNVAIAGLRGPVLVNFWAQWCTECKDESPLLEQLYQSAKGRLGLVGVDFLDPRPGAALAFAKQYGLTYPQVADPDGAAKAPLRISGLPFTFFVDATGKITYTQVGPIHSQSELASLVHEHLGVDVPAGGGS